MSRASLLALLPAVMVPALLAMVRDSLWPAVLAYHALCVGAPLAFHCSAKDVGLTRSEVRAWLPLTLTISVSLLGAAGIANHLISIEALLPEGWERLLFQAHPWWAFVTYSLLVNAFCEEYFWRGFLLPKTGIAWGSVFFWLMHATAASIFVNLVAAVWFTVPALLAGLMWGWMRRRFHSLWPAVLTHLAADVAILWLAADLL